MGRVKHILIGDPDQLDLLLLRYLDMLPPPSARKPNADEQAGDYGDDLESDG
jgi:hypothetical protein